MIFRAIKIVVITITTLLISSVISKADSIDDFFNKYSKLDNATFVNITPEPDLLDAAISMSNENVNTPEMKKLLNNLKNIKILTVEKAYQQLIEKIFNETQKVFPLKSYKKFLEVKEKDETVQIFYKGEKSNVEEFLLITKEKEEITIIWIKGKIDFKDLPKIQGIFNNSPNPSKGK